jgi:hypothetical protein
MNHASDHGRLLHDVLADAAPAGFREALLGETLRLARQRRRGRNTRRITASLAVLALATIGGWRVLVPEPLKPGSAANYQLVRSTPLRAEQIVTTQPLAAGQVVASVATTDVIHTASGGLREIDDDQLLALAAPQVAALIRRGPREAELVFVQPTEPPPDQQN